MFALIYFVMFAIIAGSAFALMYANIKAISMMDRPVITRPHPEAPEPGEEIMYVDLSRERLEDLYKLSENQTEEG